MPEKHHHVPWLAILLVIVAIAFLAAGSGQTQNVPGLLTPTVSNISEGVPPQASIPINSLQNAIGSATTYTSSEAAMPTSQAIVRSPDGSNMYYQHGGQPNVTDTREYNKTTYEAGMRSRDVQGLTKKVETTVRGYGGRVDQMSSSAKSGYISFVVPATKFDDFRNELENLVDSRFLNVDIQSENLLPQKQGIENAQSTSQQQLDDFNASKTKLTAQHKVTINSLQSQLDTDTSQIASLQSQTSTDPTVQAQTTAAIQTLADDQKNLRTRIANENSNYTSQLNTLNAQITWAQSSLDNADSQNQNLLDNVATVDGSVSITWISIWEIIQLYVPAYWFAILFAVLAIGAFIYQRRRERSN